MTPGQVAAWDQIEAAVRDLEDALKRAEAVRDQTKRRLHLKLELLNTAPWAFLQKARLRQEIASLG